MQKTCHGEEKDKKRQGFDLINSDEETYYSMDSRLKNTKRSILIKGDRNQKRVT